MVCNKDLRLNDHWHEFGKGVFNRVRHGGGGGHKILLGSLRRRRVINYFGDALMHALDAAAATVYGLFISVLVYESSLTFNRFVIKFWYLKELWKPWCFGNLWARFDPRKSQWPSRRRNLFGIWTDFRWYELPTMEHWGRRWGTITPITESQGVSFLSKQKFNKN